MSFDLATDYMKKYHENRAIALRSNKPIKWFTSPTTSYSELLNTTFDRTKENDEWYKKWTVGTSAYDTLMRFRLKVHYLAGAARDIRFQYVGGGQDTREKTLSDFIRYEWARARFMSVMIITRLKKMFEDKSVPKPYKSTIV